MSSLYWLRIARKAKLYKQPEYPHVEALLESESQKPGEDFRMLAKIVPASIIVCGLLVSIAAVFTQRSLWPLLATLGSGAIATATWFILDHYDKKISRAKVRVRKLSKEVVQRVCGFSNIVGVEPALSPAVGPILDEAAAIYMKHCAEHPNQAQRIPNENRFKAERALEEAMASMMELAVPPNVRAQDLELQKGWALPLLEEMREMDRALTSHARAASSAPLVDPTDPLANLREARLELQGNENALSELRQNLSE